MTVPSIKLSENQKTLLLRHIDGPVSVSTDSTHDMIAMRVLIKKGLLRDSRPGTPSPRPVSTVMTQKGRFLMASMLASYAEALVIAGCIEAEIAAAISDNTARRLRIPLQPSPLAIPFAAAD